MTSEIRSDRLRIVHSTSERFSRTDRKSETELLYDFLYDGEYVGRRRVDSETRRMLLKEFYDLCELISRTGDREENYDAVLALGKRLSQVMLPKDLSNRLSGVTAGQILELETSDADVPWELCVVSGTPILSRAVVARSIPFGATKNNRWPTAIRMTVVGDPFGDLPAAKAEAEEVARQLAELGSVAPGTRKIEVSTELLVGDDATKRRVLLEGLLDDSVAPAVFHYAGHVVFDPLDDVRSCLRLADADLKAYEVAQLGGNPFVFINGCRSSGSESPELPTLGTLQGMAGQFIAGGAKVYLGTIWALDDDLGAAFAMSYYERLIAGGALAEAYWDGMSAVDLARPNSVTRLGYILFGSPHARLWTSPRVLATGPYINYAGIDAIIRLERDYAAAECLVVEDLPWVLWSDSDVKSWTDRLPVSLEERRACRELLKGYRNEFTALISTGKRRLDCVILMSEIRRYFDRLELIDRERLADEIIALGRGETFKICFIDSPGLDELEVVSSVPDVMSARPGQAVYVFNKQTRLEDNALQYYLYQETDWALVSEYIQRFSKTFAGGLRYTEGLCGRMNIRWIADQSYVSVAEIVRRWDSV